MEARDTQLEKERSVLAPFPDEPTGRISSSRRAPRLKRTFHLPPEDVYTLDELQAAEHRCTGKKPELSQLVSEAIRLLSRSRTQDSGPS